MLRSGPDEARLLADVVDEDRSSLLDRRADDALADLEAKRPAQRPADNRRRTRCAAPAVLVEQIDRERAEPREPRDELRDLLEQIARSSTDVTSRPSSNSVDSSSVSVAGRSGAAGGGVVWSFIESLDADYTEPSPMESLTLPLDYSAIERIIPHRYPFLLVDRITELEPDKRIVGIKNVSLERAVPVAPAGRRRRRCRLRF